MRVPTPTRALPRTLRGRLIAGLLVLLAVAGATVGLVTYLAVQKSLVRELTNNLQTATGLTYDCFHPNGDVGTTGRPGSADPDAAGDTGRPSPTDAPSPAANPVPGSLSQCQGLG
jgi:two-component system OmpR family sensor kinase